MKEIEIINLVKEWAYRTDYKNGQKGYELSEQELKKVAKTIVEKFDLYAVGCSLKNKQVPTFEEYLELCYIKLNHNYRSKETLQNYSLEEIEQRYTWMKNL